MLNILTTGERGGFFLLLNIYIYYPFSSPDTLPVPLSLLLPVFTSKGNSNVYLILLLLFHSCFNIQVPGRPVACVLQSDKREEPLSRHEVVSAMLRDVQGLLCTKNATKELTSVRLAGSQLFAILLFINTHTPTHAFSDQILSDDI